MLLTRALGCKSFLGALQFLLGVCGLFLVFYVPMANSCGQDSITPMAAITVSERAGSW